MRSLFIILLIASPVMAGDGDWGATRYGSNEKEPGAPGKSSGNAVQMDVRAHAANTLVATLAQSTPIQSDQDGTGSDVDTVWYDLKIMGGSDPTWKITTNINGEGEATAETVIQGSAWSESIEVIKVSGDNQNQGAGALAVSDSGGGAISISVPKGFDISFPKTARSKATDNYVVKSPKTTAGAGGICRIRVDTAAKAHSTASTWIGHASTDCLGHLTVGIEMQGSSTVDGIEVKDVFRVYGLGVGDQTSSKVDEPRGGYEWDREVTPTDAPTDQEKAEALPDEDDEEKESSGDSSTADSGGATTGD